MLSHHNHHHCHHQYHHPDQKGQPVLAAALDPRFIHWADPWSTLVRYASSYYHGIIMILIIIVIVIVIIIVII